MSEYSDAVEWLEHAGLVLRSKCVATPKFPLDGYLREHFYKIFMLDVGLLGAMSRLPAQIILEGNQLFVEFKGAFTENFVAQELTQEGYPLFYWSSEQLAEMDFILPHDADLIPLEVKSGKGGKMKSLQLYAEKFSPRFLACTSLSNYKKRDNLFNVPLYAVATTVQQL